MARQGCGERGGRRGRETGGGEQRGRGYVPEPNTSQESRNRGEEVRSKKCGEIGAWCVHVCDLARGVLVKSAGPEHHTP